MKHYKLTSTTSDDFFHIVVTNESMKNLELSEDEEKQMLLFLRQQLKSSDWDLAEDMSKDGRDIYRCRAIGVFRNPIKFFVWDW